MIISAKPLDKSPVNLYNRNIRPDPQGRQTERAEAAEFAGGIANLEEEMALDDERSLIDKDKIPCSVDEMYEAARAGDHTAVAWVLRRTLHLERQKRYNLMSSLKFSYLGTDNRGQIFKGFLNGREFYLHIKDNKATIHPKY